MIDSCVLAWVRQAISASFVVPLLFFLVSCPLALISIRHALRRANHTCAYTCSAPLTLVDVATGGGVETRRQWLDEPVVRT